MKRILSTLAAVAALILTTAVPATAATTTQAVSYATFSAVTGAPSACAVVVPNVSNLIPVPAAVEFEAAHVLRTGYHSVTGYAWINAGYPGNILAANRTTSGVYPPHEYHAFIPGYAGRSCSQWVHLVAQA